MRNLAIILLTSIALTACNNQPGSASSTGLADKKVRASIIKAGLFKTIRSGGVINSSSTNTGKAIAKPVLELVKITNQIPLIKDMNMSFQYRIMNLPDKPSYIKLRRVLKHPPMQLPDGTVSTGSDYTIKNKVSIGQVVAYTGYGLNEKYEMLEGDWTFQIWHKDEMLIEQTFSTYLPDEADVQQPGNNSLTVNNHKLVASNLQAEK